jgi:hypothetical protein
MANHVIEIARQEGTEFRSVRLALEKDGAINRVWGDGDYEFWVHVAPTMLPKLAFELLREKFASQLDAVDAFRNWCNAHGVEHTFDSWV